MKHWTFVLPLVIMCSAASADICSDVIEGASLDGYEGKYGGYDGNGLCHKRDISEEECRARTGGLFYAYSPDRGMNYTHCAFRPPSKEKKTSNSSNFDPPPKELSDTNYGSIAAPKPAPEENDYTYDPGKKKPECDRWSQTFLEQLKKITPEMTESEVRSLLLLPVNMVDKECLKVGQINAVSFALSKFKEKIAEAQLKSQAQTLQRDGSTSIDNAPARPTQQSDEVDPKVRAECEQKARETAWCRSDNPKIGQYRNCISKPFSTTGSSGSFTIEALSACPRQQFLAVVSTYDENDKCSRTVVMVKAYDPLMSQPPRVSSNGVLKTPKILDAIPKVASPELGVSDDDLWRCYYTRHEGCPCNN